MLIGIVESEPSIREILKFVLEHDGHHVQGVQEQGEGAEAWIIDPGHPRTAKLSEIPEAAIVISVYDEVIWACELLGIRAIAKPFSVYDIRQVVAEIAAEKTQ